MKRHTVLLVALMLVVICAASVPMLVPMPVPTETLPSTRELSDMPTVTVKASLLANDTFFPLGFMGVKESDFNQMAASGFNVVHPFAGEWASIAFCEEYLHQAEAAGLQVIMDLLPCKAYAGGWDEQGCGECISTLAAHDNFAGWFLPDEIKDFEVAANLYEWVQKYDPRQRPVYGNPGSFDFETIQRFPAFSDFLWGAWYPEYDGLPRADVTRGTRLSADACRGTGTRWGTILQFFDSADFGRRGGYPTAHELRCDSYQAIIAGATGLWYFYYDLGQGLDGLLAETETIADEIIGTGELDEVILSPDVPQTIARTILSGPTQSPPIQGEVYDSIQTLQKEYQGIYLFAVNVATDIVVVEFSNLPAGIEVEVLFEGRRIPISDGTFRDSFAEADVHIYRVVSDP